MSAITTRIRANQQRLDKALLVSSLRYHKAQALDLGVAFRLARRMEETTHAKGQRAASETWHELGNGLDSAIHAHKLFITTIGAKL